MDPGFVVTLNPLLLHPDGVEDPLSAYERFAEVLFAGALVLAFLFAAGRSRAGLRRTAVAAGLSAGLGLVLAQMISRLIDRPRPFVADPAHVHLFASHALDA